MDFKRFGSVGFISETKAEDFVRFLEEGKIAMTKCRKCGKSYFPPRMDCGACGESEMDWIEIRGTGELVAFSRVMYGPTGFESDVPYTIAVVRFPNGIQVFGRISGRVGTDSVKIGMKLKIKPITLPSERVSYEFLED